MAYQDTMQRIVEYRREIAAIRSKMRELARSIEPQVVADYSFEELRGSVLLAQLFAERDTLIVIHSMGTSCPYCTMWGDGYNGVYEHLASRASFVLTGPDDPTVQHQFARERGWRFRIVSHRSSSFAADMGYRAKGGGFLPGLSVFKRDGARLVRVADAASKPGDDFNPVHHIFELFPEGVADWAPKARYG